jgi:acyl-CoA synthetase (AMP-forming)/AMP-acid ligase II
MDAALPCGAVVVPMNPPLKEREIACYLGDSGARFLFAWLGGTTLPPLDSAPGTTYSSRERACAAAPQADALMPALP